MRTIVSLALGAALVLAGLGAVTWGLREALDARRLLVAELTAAMAPARSLDVLGQQLRVEAGAASSGRALLDEALAAARTGAQRQALESLAACAGDGGCADPAPALTRAREEGAQALQASWSRVDEAEARARRLSWLGLGLAVLGLVLGATAAARPKGAAPAPPPLAPGDDGEVQRLLRERLQALYAARTQLNEGARFGAFGELAAALSHGLKTPLAGISAAVQLAQLKLGDGHPARAELDEVVQLTAALTEQVQRFLRAAGQVGPTRQRVAVQSFVELVQTAYEAEAKQRGVTLVALDETVGRQVEVDGSLLEMALRNLVENALAATAPGPSATVRLTARLTSPPTRVGLDGTPPPAGTWLALAVEDDGPGLPAAAKRTETGVTTRAQGSGLGLAIARRVAERHGGALVLEDNPTGGARVSLVLPALEGGAG